MTPSIRIVRLVCIAAAAIAPLTTLAQNVATVNGKPVPKARVDLLLSQAARGGQQKSPELEARAREEVVLREIFAQEAEKRGIPASADYKAQMELVRQTVLIRELFEEFKKKNPVTDVEAKAEYDKFKSQASGTEYKARHILVENEDEAKKLITQIKGGAKFEELAKKNSKDTGSGENGGDLDFAKPDSYVPEFGKAMVALKKGEMTETPVKRNTAITSSAWKTCARRSSPSSTPSSRRSNSAWHRPNCEVPGRPAQIGQDRLQVLSATVAAQSIQADTADRLRRSADAAPCRAGGR